MRTEQRWRQLYREVTYRNGIQLGGEDNLNRVEAVAKVGGEIVQRDVARGRLEQRQEVSRSRAEEVGKLLVVGDDILTEQSA